MLLIGTYITLCGTIIPLSAFIRILIDQEFPNNLLLLYSEHYLNEATTNVL